MNPDVYDVYSMWAWVRYLGLFDQDYGARLVLSAEARHIRGNQRRVASEELGIGFAKVFGEKWMLDSLGAGSVTFVDVDVVPHGGTIPFAGGRHVVTSVSSQRPDYFMIHTNFVTGRSTVRVLESKGTSNYGNQVNQLARAVHQLEGVHIDGSSPVGLAVSAGLPNRGAVRVLSVDPPDHERQEPVYDVRPSLEDLGRDGVDEIKGRPPNGVFEASLAQLADYAGAAQAARAWAPAGMRRRLADRPQVDDVTRETPVGTCVGRRSVFEANGQGVEVFAGVTAELHAALVSLDTEQVLSAQAALAETYASRRGVAAEAFERGATSIGIDGTVLHIRLRG